MKFTKICPLGVTLSHADKMDIKWLVVNSHTVTVPNNNRDIEWNLYLLSNSMAVIFTTIHRHLKFGINKAQTHHIKFYFLPCKQKTLSWCETHRLSPKPMLLKIISKNFSTNCTFRIYRKYLIIVLKLSSVHVTDSFMLIKLIVQFRFL